MMHALMSASRKLYNLVALKTFQNIHYRYADVFERSRRILVKEVA